MKIEMRRFFFTLIPALLLTFFLPGCKSEPAVTTKDDYHIPFADSLLAEYNKDKPEWDRGTRTEGMAAIEAQEHAVYIYHTPDSMAEQLSFFVQTEQKNHRLKINLKEKSEVINLGRTVIINSLLRDLTIVLRLETDKEPEYLKDLPGATVFAGYGLGKRSNYKGLAEEVAPICSCEPPGVTSASCANGNFGQLECGISNTGGGCRIICTGQKQACCGKQ